MKSQMTEEQALQIRELRSKGLGYSSISKMVRLPKYSVRYYCRKRGIAGFPIEYEMNLEERLKDGSACTFCGAELNQPHVGRKRHFCSDICRRRYWKIHRDELRQLEKSTYTMECNYCHEIFESYANKTRKYCCHEHYILDRFGPRELRAVPSAGAAFFIPEKEIANGV